MENYNVIVFNNNYNQHIMYSFLKLIHIVKHLIRVDVIEYWLISLSFLESKKAPLIKSNSHLSSDSKGLENNDNW